jgi:hypothetical protein
MPQGFIPLSKQMDFLWNEVQGKEKSGFGKFLTANASSPEDYATLWDKYYERSGGAGDEKARNYASSVYAAMADGTSNEALISPNAKFAYGYLTQKGLTPQQAAGITGRLMAESYEDMNPDARNTLAGGKGTYGIAQWRGSRLQDLADFTGADIGDITSLPATKPSGGLLTSNQGGQDMAISNKPPYMMGGEQTYNAPNMRQPAPQQAQQGGMRGLLSTLKDAATAVDPNTGLTGFQTFASALDPLILPELRGGGEAIRKSGAARVARGQLNKTIEWLSNNGYPEMAAAVRANPGAASNIMSAVLSKKLTPKKDDGTTAMQNYQFLISRGMSEEEALKQAFGKGGPNINLGSGAQIAGDYVIVEDPTSEAGVRFVPIPGGKADQAAQQAQEREQVSEQQSAQKEAVVSNSIGNLISMIDKGGIFDLPEAGIVGNVLGSLGVNQEAVDFRNELASIQANIAFDRLQQMREASKTGGALGAVSERELDLLMNAYGNINQSTSPEKLKENLINIRNIMTKIENDPVASSFYYGSPAQGAQASPQSGGTQVGEAY